jgi:hypothetical protein
VFGRDPTADKKTIIAVTADGRLAQLWDTDRWNLSFPAELAGLPVKVKWSSVAVVVRDPIANKKTIVAVDGDGSLVQLWDTDQWNMSFPGELAGYFGRFRPGAVVFGRDPIADKKTIIAVTTNGRMIQLWDTDRWNSNFPAELARV